MQQAIRTGLKFFADAAASSAGKEAVTAVFVGKVFHIWGARSAYYGRLGEQQLHPTFLYWPSLQAAVAFVESSRRQGTDWHIRELPAIVLQADSGELALTDAAAELPFADVEFLAPPSRTVAEIERSVRSRTQREVQSFLAPKGTFPPAALPLVQWDASPPSVKRNLDWGVGKYWQPELGALLAVHTALTKHLQATR